MQEQADEQTRRFKELKDEEKLRTAERALQDMEYEIGKEMSPRELMSEFMKKYRQAGTMVRRYGDTTDEFRLRSIKDEATVYGVEEELLGELDRLVRSLKVRKIGRAAIGAAGAVVEGTAGVIGRTADTVRRDIGRAEPVEDPWTRETERLMGDPWKDFRY